MVESKVTIARKRTRKSARAAGATFERSTADYFKDQLQDKRIDRRVKYGKKDKGDIANVFMVESLGGGEVVIECKNTAKLDVNSFLSEAETERKNADAPVGLVVSKRHGIGAPGRQLVLMTVDDLICLIRGSRPNE